MNHHPLSSPANPLVKHLVKLRDDRAYRYREKRVLIQGVKVVTEVGRQYPPKTLMVANEALIPLGVDAERIIIASADVMHKVSGVVAGEGIVAEIEMPKWAQLHGKQRIVALDGITDPGNLGTLLRTALALGWTGVYLLDGCCDPYNDKAIRAAMGATFKLPLATGSWEQLKSLCQAQKWTAWAADVHGENPEKVSFDEGLVLVLGSESHGVSHEAREFCQSVAIPMPGPMESLNVSIAGGILMYLLGRPSSKVG